MPTRHPRGRRAASQTSPGGRGRRAPQTSSRRRGRRAALRAFLRRALESGVTAVERTLRAFRRRPEATVEVLIADRVRARSIQREVRAGLRRLRRLLGPALLDDLSVGVQYPLDTDPQLASRHELLARRDGGYGVLVRLALSVDGREIGTDRVLAALANECIVLAGLERSELVVRIGQAT